MVNASGAAAFGWAAAVHVPSVVVVGEVAVNGTMVLRTVEFERAQLSFNVTASADVTMDVVLPMAILSWDSPKRNPSTFCLYLEKFTIYFGFFFVVLELL